jgi:hypothetical protein
MAVESVMLPLGTTAPPFFLPEVVSGQVYSLDSFHGKDALLVMFICRHCPYVQHVEQELAEIGKAIRRKAWHHRHQQQRSATYPTTPPTTQRDGPTVDFASVCFDETQEVANAYKAGCTPDFMCSMPRAAGIAVS